MFGLNRTSVHLYHGMEFQELSLPGSGVGTKSFKSTLWGRVETQRTETELSQGLLVLGEGFATPLHQLGVWRELCRLPQWVRGEAKVV